MIFSGQAARTVRLGLKSLFMHKLRTFLASLGILIGVAAVIWMLSIGEGGRREALRSIKALGSNNLILESKKPPELANEQTTGMFRAQAYGLTYDDADAISETLPAVQVVVPVRDVPKKVRYGKRVLNASILGTDPRYVDVSGLKVAEGRFLVRRDLERKRNVAVIGAAVAKELFPFESPIGKPLRIGAESFRVVGALEAPRSADGGAAATAAQKGVFVPLPAARSFFGELTVKSTGGSREFELVQLHEIKVMVEDDRAVLGTAEALRSLMARLHKKKDYKLTVPLELLRQKEAQQFIWTVVLSVIAGLSLLVGGIGIMNVMLATVTERTREIGIRRALGAKRKHIVSQFLVETVVLSCGGGLVGVGIGVAAPPLLTHYVPDIHTSVLPSFAMLAFGISAGVGLVFGLYPAWRAAQMDPVEALRHE